MPTLTAQLSLSGGARCAAEEGRGVVRCPVRASRRACLPRRRGAPSTGCGWDAYLPGSVHCGLPTHRRPERWPASWLPSGCTCVCASRAGKCIMGAALPVVAQKMQGWSSGVLTSAIWAKRGGDSVLVDSVSAIGEGCGWWCRRREQVLTEGQCLCED